MYYSDLTTENKRNSQLALLSLLVKLHVISIDDFFSAQFLMPIFY